MTVDRVFANHPACVTCAAKTRSSEGFICEPWKLGQSNKKRRFVIGRRHTSGTTLRPQLCPHPDHKVSTARSTQVMLRELMNK